MAGLLNLPHLLVALAVLAFGECCYYYYYIENPNDFAYRFCSCGVSPSYHSVSALLIHHSVKS